MDLIIRGKGIDKEKAKNKVRDWDQDKNGAPLISFAWDPIKSVHQKQDAIEFNF